ncbi:MAG: hypothetical protein INH37_27560, partial [Myxococcaceae bacterium]|nr:hypothetical protein [Myxococcaceae bacterium]
MDPCATNNGGCGSNAVCSADGGAHTCACEPGYVGDGGVCLWSSPALSGLAVAPGQLTFNAGAFVYAVTLQPTVAAVQVTASVPNPAGVTLTVDRTSAMSGVPSSVTLTSLPRLLPVEVRSQTGRASTYTVALLAPTVQTAYRKATNTRADDGFGTALSLSVDGSALAIGAPGEDTRSSGINGIQNGDASQSGMAYLLAWSGSAWTQPFTFKASNTEPGDGFGSAVALSGDGATLVVGAPFEDSIATGVNQSQVDNSSMNSGAVYVFVRSGPTWVQQAYLKASNTGAAAAFGSSLAVTSDGSLLVVGAPGEASAATGIGGPQGSTAAPQSGAVYVFQRNGTNWAQVAYVKASNGATGDQFGASVSVSGIGTTFVVGAPGEDSAATGIDGDQGDDTDPESGAAYIFVRSGAAWSQAAYVKASNT